jgi:hypothetical protein
MREGEPEVLLRSVFHSQTLPHHRNDFREQIALSITWLIFFSVRHFQSNADHNSSSTSSTAYSFFIRPYDSRDLGGK